MPVDLHQRLSEFSYGYGVTREVERLLQNVGLRTTPFLPSLLQEKKLAFDVAFDRPGAPLLLQFKLGEALQRLHMKDKTEPPPAIGRPFWRFRIDTAEPSGQFDLLLKAEQAGAEVYYVAPRFTSWDGYILAYESDQVLERSLLLRPSEIDDELASAGEVDGPHRVLYDDFTSLVLSEPRELTEVRAAEFAGQVRSQILHRSRRMDLMLGDVYQALERPREVRIRPPNPEEQSEGAYVKRFSDPAELSPSPSHLSADRSRRFSEFQQRAATEADARFAALGFEAWAVGSQVIAVTLPEST
jgi:hypothetical protein